jgi:hypothetical protein
MLSISLQAFHHETPCKERTEIQQINHKIMVFDVKLSEFIFHPCVYIAVPTLV